MGEVQHNEEKSHYAPAAPTLLFPHVSPKQRKCCYQNLPDRCPPVRRGPALSFGCPCRAPPGRRTADSFCRGRPARKRWTSRTGGRTPRNVPTLAAPAHTGGEIHCERGKTYCEHCSTHEAIIGFFLPIFPPSIFFAHLKMSLALKHLSGSKAVR